MLFLYSVIVVRISIIASPEEYKMTAKRLNFTKDFWRVFQKTRQAWTNLSDTKKFWALLLGVAIALLIFQDKENSITRPQPVVQTSISPAEFVRACLTAHDAIKAKLISPTTADFPNCVYATKREHELVHIGNKMFVMYGYVDSQNVYGAKIRQQWWVNLTQTADFKFTPVDLGIN